MKLMRLKEALEVTGLSKATIERLEKQLLFPKRLKLTKRAVCWVQSDVNKWIEEKVKGGANEQQ